MKLTKAQKDSIKGMPIPDKCPGCGHKHFLFFDEIVEMREYHEGYNVPGAAMSPLVQLCCECCSMMFFYSALRLGLVGTDGKVKL